MAPNNNLWKLRLNIATNPSRGAPSN